MKACKLDVGFNIELRSSQEVLITSGNPDEMYT